MDFQIKREYYKIHNKSFNLFKIKRWMDSSNVKNDYSRAKKDVKDRISDRDSEGVSSYTQYLLEIIPHFMGHQPIEVEAARMHMSRSVVRALENLWSLLEGAGILKGEYILLWKKSPMRIDLALIYEHELPGIKAKLLRFETPDLEWYGNSYMLSRKKYECLTKDYEKRILKADCVVEETI